jgi:hypothetical protein
MLNHVYYAKYSGLFRTPWARDLLPKSLIFEAKNFSGLLPILVTQQAGKLIKDF